MSKFKKAGGRIKILKNLNENLQKEKDKSSDENNILKKELNVLSKNYIILEKEKKVYIDENRTLSNENTNLKKEIKKLKPLVDKLTLSSNKLELLLKDQNRSNNKSRIGYDNLGKSKISITKFVQSIASTSISKPAGYIPKKTYQKSTKTYVRHRETDTHRGRRRRRSVESLLEKAREEGDRYFKDRAFVKNMTAMIGETSIVHRQQRQVRRNIHISGEVKIAGDGARRSELNGEKKSKQ